MSDKKIDLSRNFKLWAVGTAIAVTGACIYYALTYTPHNSERQRRHQQRKVERWLESSFPQNKFEIINYIDKQDWNSFSIKQLKTICRHFCDLLPAGTKCGWLTHGQFDILLRQMNINDDAIIENICRMWDSRGDGHVDFLELVEGLNVIVYGSTTQKLQFYFSMYDLNDDGFITRGDLLKMCRAFLTHLNDSEIQAHVSGLLASFDDNHDSRISFAEFSRHMTASTASHTLVAQAAPPPQSSSSDAVSGGGGGATTSGTSSSTSAGSMASKFDAADAFNTRFCLLFGIDLMGVLTIQRQRSTYY